MHAKSAGFLVGPAEYLYKSLIVVDWASRGGLGRNHVIDFDSITLQPVAAPVPPTARSQAPIAPIAERDPASRDPRQHNNSERQQGVTFRSFITASTLEGLGRALGGDKQLQSDSSAPQYRSRPTKLPDAGPALLSGAEAANYYRAVSGDSESLAAAREFRDATSSYARNYFSVSGTFARPDESLELTA